jgi:hypothetical protein
LNDSAVLGVFTSILGDEKKKKKKTKKIDGRLKLGGILWGKSSVTGASLSVPPPPIPPPLELFHMLQFPGRGHFHGR